MTKRLQGKSVVEHLGDPFYEGSVQRLYAYPDDTSLMVAETTAGGSVFDVGTIFEIPGSDKCRALFRHVLFERLADCETWNRVEAAIAADCDLSTETKQLLLKGAVLQRLRNEGATTHHVGMLDAVSGELVGGRIPDIPSVFNDVRRFQILHPEPAEVYGSHLYDYSKFAVADGYVIPLEAIVRFGVTGASSVYHRSLKMGGMERAAFLSELGVVRLDPWRMLSRPVLDFTSKYEPTDRPVTRQEALNMAGITAEQFSEMTQLAVLGAYVVKLMLGDIGLRLWDLKWEFAIENGRFFFVDTVDTDSVRATCPSSCDGQAVALHVNKQAIRDYYEIFHGDWIDGVHAAKSAAKTAGADFHAVFREGQVGGDFPKTPELDPDFVAIQAEKLAFVEAYLRGADAASAIADQLAWVCGKELAYYEERGKLEVLVSRNTIS